MTLCSSLPLSIPLPKLMHAQVVVANVLGTHRKAVKMVTKDSEQPIQLMGADECEGVELEAKLVQALMCRHRAFMGQQSSK